MVVTPYSTHVAICGVFLILSLCVLLFQCWHAASTVHHDRKLNGMFPLPLCIRFVALRVSLAFANLIVTLLVSILLGGIIMGLFIRAVST